MKTKKRYAVHIFDRFTKKLQLYHLEKNLNSEERRKINSNQRSFTCNRTNKFFFSLYLINTRERAKGMPRGGPPRSNEATVLSSKEISSSLNLPLSLSLSLSVSLSLGWNYATRRFPGWKRIAAPRRSSLSCRSSPPRHGGINFWNSLIVVSVVWKVVGCQVESSRLHCRTEKERERERRKRLPLVSSPDSSIRASKFEVKKRMKALKERKDC